jgi:hypothetical protein
MGHDCTETVGAVRHRVDFTNRPGQNPIVKFYETYSELIKPE